VISLHDEFYFTLRVYHEDVDTTGVVYNANYLKFMERARTEWLNAIGFDQRHWLAQDLGFAVHSANLTFTRPARFNDELEILSRITAIGKASFQFEQTVRKKGDPEHVFCIGQIKVACIDIRKFTPRAIPKELING
jgi:tol-pal system-associated acyl-CoA thioesterase